MTRTLLNADLTLYVDSSTGSDSNNGSMGSPFQTINYGIAKMARDYDYQGFKPCLQLAAGTYSENVILPADYISGMTTTTLSCPTILGDTANPQNYIIDGGTGGIGIFGSCNMPWKMKGVKMQAAGGIAVEMDEKGHIFFEGVEFGVADIHCHSILDSVFKFVNSGYKISAGAVVHWNATPLSKIIMQPGYAITLSGTPAFSVGFAQNDGGYIEAQGISTSGSATGKRYLLQNGGRLAIGAVTLPGSIAGTNSGGYLT